MPNQIPGGLSTQGTPGTYQGHLQAPAQLGPDEQLESNQSLRSPNGEYILLLAPDGDLVLSRTKDNRQLWKSGTQGKGAARAIMQLDGNFVLYTASGAPVWASNTVKKDHSLVPGLAMQDDGNVVVYHSGMPVWATGTSVGDVAAAKIKRLHQRLGGTRGPLGNAVSGVGKEGGVYVRRFDAGEIRWAVDDGAKAYSEYYARILYKGLHCFGETGGLGSDEPYAIVSVYNPASREKVRTYKFGPYENVDGGSTRVEILQLWDDAASDIAVHTLVMEHDAGDHDAVRKAIQDALKKAADAAAAAFGVPTPPEWIDTLTLGVAEGITSIFGLGDDVVGQDAFLIRRGELVSLAQQPVVALKKFGPIEFNYPTDDADRPPISDGDASYKAYFEVVAGRREEPQLIVI